MLCRETIEQPIPAVKLGPEPMPVARPQRVALTELGAIWVTWDQFANVVIDGCQDFRRGVRGVSPRVVGCQSPDSFRQLL